MILNKNASFNGEYQYRDISCKRESNGNSSIGKYNT